VGIAVPRVTTCVSCFTGHADFYVGYHAGDLSELCHKCVT